VSESLVYLPKDLERLLPGIGRNTRQKIARELGIRVSPRRIVIPRVRLEAWLRGNKEAAGPATEDGAA
jgi:branched-subunit amino acid aminotransferase/4-amino-4-deoxychorismate lyase